MKYAARLAVWMVAIFFLAPGLPAQSAVSRAPAQTGNPSRTAGNNHQISITGCLKRAHDTGVYYLTDQDGTTWALTADAIDLAVHVNHSVMIAGKEASTQADEDGQGAAGKAHYAMRVMSLKMLSPSCTR
jgi:hypothetical protein